MRRWQHQEENREGKKEKKRRGGSQTQKGFFRGVVLRFPRVQNAFVN